jgi:hypothetical protein
MIRITDLSTLKINLRGCSELQRRVIARRTCKLAAWFQYALGFDRSKAMRIAAADVRRRIALR